MPPGAGQVPAVPGRTILRRKEKPRAAVSRNLHPSCQSPGGSSRPHIGTATVHPNAGDLLEEGSRPPKWLTCAPTRRGEPQSQLHQQNRQQTVMKGTVIKELSLMVLRQAGRGGPSTRPRGSGPGHMTCSGPPSALCPPASDSTPELHPQV